MIVIVGSRDLWLTPEITGSIVAAVATTDPGTAIGVRVSQADEPPSPVERFVSEIAQPLGRVVQYWKTRGDGRSGVYRRDYEMVEHADSVLAFFAPEQEMDGGTGHVVKAALDREVKVEAYGLNDHGGLELLGSDEGKLRSRPQTLRDYYDWGYDREDGT